MPARLIDTHVHVGVLGPDPPPSPAARSFMEPQEERGAISRWMRHQIPFRVFLLYNRIEPDQVSDRLLRETTLRTIQESMFDYVVCLALDAVYTESGERHPDLSNMWVANEYVVDLARDFRELLPPEQRERRGILLGASVHPYAPNFKDRVRWCVDQGAVLLKWLPSAQHINLAHPKVGEALEFLAQAGREGRPLPLLLHVGAEYAIITTNPATTSYDFLSWSGWDRFWNSLRPKAKRWATPDIAGIERNLGRGLEAGACVIFAHCGLPYYAPNFFAKWAEHSDLPAVRSYLQRYRGKDGARGKCFADVSALVTPFRKSYFDQIRKFPADAVLAASDFPVPVFELSADVRENLEDLGAVLRGEVERVVIPEGNLLDVNWRELQHAFPGHLMFENANQVI